VTRAVPWPAASCWNAERALVRGLIDAAFSAAKDGDLSRPFSAVRSAREAAADVWASLFGGR
jgi:hypothetical protein